MKAISLLLLALLCSAAGADPTMPFHIDCGSTATGKCPEPPAPPVPPAPPAPPVPPAPPLRVLPETPAGAHAACAGKAPGATLTYVIRKGEGLTGTCEKQGDKMVFEAHWYHPVD